MRLKHVLAMTLAGLAAVAVLVSFLIIYLVFRAERVKASDARLMARAEAAARVPLKSLKLLEPRIVAIYGPHGRPVAFTKEFGKAPPAWNALDGDGDPPEEGAPFDLTIGGKQHRAVVVSTPRPGERLLYLAPRRTLRRTLQFLNWLFLPLLGGALLLTSLVAWWLGGRLTRDVDAIAQVSRKVASGDLSARINGPPRGTREIRDLREDLNLMIAALDTLMTRQQTFVAHAAHELRSPLAALRGELELALRRERSPEEYREAFQKVLAEIEQLTGLAEDLLLLARIHRRSQPGVGTRLADLVQDAARLARPSAEARGVILSLPSESSLEATVLVSRTDGARALRNLLDNAVAHSEPGSRVTLTAAEAADNAVQLSVEDQGSGIPAEEAPHLFTAFFRGTREQASDRPGAGLGLTIAREIARAHGGDLVLDPTYRGGARFALSFPKGGAASGS